MNLIRKLDWFFKLEKRRYMIGILALSLVSVFNLIPPRVIGQVIDRIARQSLTTEEMCIRDRTKVVAKSGTLPNTGDNSNHEVGVVGAGLLSAALLAALGVSKRKEEEL